MTDLEKRLTDLEKRLTDIDKRITWEIATYTPFMSGRKVQTILCRVNWQSKG